MYLTINQPRSLAQVLAPWALVFGAIAKSLKDAMVFMADQFCDVETPEYVQLECGSELGGIVAVGFIDESVDVGATDAAIITNLQDEGWWADQIGASPAVAWALKNTRGSLPAGTPTEEEGFGLNSIERTGDDRELSFEVPGVFLLNNRNFVAGINKKTGLGLVYVTAGRNGAGYEAFYVSNVSVYMSDLIEQSIKSRKRYAGSAKWSTDMTPGLPFIAPTEIFI